MSVAEEQTEVTGIDRRHFLRLGGMSLAAAAALAACGNDDEEIGAGADEGDQPDTPEEAKGSASDIQFLNLATASERSATVAYEKMIEKIGDQDEELRNTLNTMSGHHEEHFAVLAGATEALGGDTNRDENDEISTFVERDLAAASGPDSIRRVAYALELRLAQLYAEFAAGADEASLHKTTLAILGSEARHVAALGLFANDPGTPPFAGNGVGLPQQPAPAPAPEQPTED